MLYIIRHAKSNRDGIALADFDRPLNERGLTDAPKMGARLAALHVHPDLMLSSPAVRALVTCQKIAAELAYPVDKIKTDKKLYHADPDQLLSSLKSLDKHEGKTEVVMIFGHNPGLTEFANSLFDEQINSLPTCSVVAGKLAIRSWDEIHWGCGKLDFLDFPKNHI